MPKLKEEKTQAPNKLKRPMSKSIFRLNDLKKEILSFRKNGLKRGGYCGFPDFHKYYSMKKGSTTYVAAPAAVGKSEFVKELMINLAMFEDWNWVVFSPETGSPKDVFADLLWGYIGKPIVRGDGFKSATDKEMDAGMKFVNDHFFVLDVGVKDLNVATYFNEIRELIESGEHVDATLIDPVTEMDIYSSGGARDLELGKFLTGIRRMSGAYNIHSVLVFHTKSVGLKQTKDVYGKDIRYYPPPQMDDIAGGLQSSRKGFFIIGLWRPPLNVINPDTDQPYEKNTLYVEVLKAKPKAIGKTGVSVFKYNPLSTRFTDSRGLGARPLDNKIPF